MEVRILSGAPNMKKQWKRAKGGVFDAKLFVAPFVLIGRISHEFLESGFKQMHAEAQRKLEEGALFARWLRKHRRAT